jgi:hypothetical protein
MKITVLSRRAVPPLPHRPQSCTMSIFDPTIPSTIVLAAEPTQALYNGSFPVTVANRASIDRFLLTDESFGPESSIILNTARFERHIVVPRRMQEAGSRATPRVDATREMAIAKLSISRCGAICVPEHAARAAFYITRWKADCPCILYKTIIIGMSMGGFDRILARLKAQPRSESH